MSQRPPSSRGDAVVPRDSPGPIPTRLGGHGIAEGQAPTQSSAHHPPAVSYDIPAAYENLDEVSGEPPVQSPDEAPLRRASSREDRLAGLSLASSNYQRRSHGAEDPELADLGRRMSAASSARALRNERRHSVATRVEYDVPDSFANLDELAARQPVENPDEDPVYRHRSLEEARSHEQEYERLEQRRKRSQAEHQGVLARFKDALAAGRKPLGHEETAGPQPVKVSRLATELYTLSYLVLFSIFGTLARLGLQSLTVYPGAPASIGVLWANFAGSLIMGFLAEDRMLFRFEWGTPTYDIEVARATTAGGADCGSSGSTGGVPAADLAAAKKAHLATKKTIPLYIGLATGFCGSFTSFSSFIRDTFLALSNALAGMGPSPVPRDGGDSVMAALAVVLLTVCMSLGGLFAGAHLAIALEPLTPSLPFPQTRRVLDRAAVVLGWGAWVGAVVMAAVPPPGHEAWRGQALFALVLAPLGCLARFYASMHLNGRFASFPLGTFVVNVSGAVVLAAAWDLAHADLGGLVGCQVLQGVEDGFCGCLTTVSTWVAELAALRRRHAYVYGGVSVAVALAFMVAIMGGLQWSRGFDGLVCSH